jgi:hypothetical protein
LRAELNAAGSGVVAFVVAATPVSVFGITSAFWALVAGVLASLAAREQGLLSPEDPRTGGSHGRHSQIAGQG